ncbi:MAG: hypothetical protein DI563_11050 [Variovorax paradoxus]|uniref:Uncharacterized protein n=1 Tax=Variovorax paradoxus TaxID=34073 RepID=A0A2W5QJB7_VARPD|nr:MAG: hypothetical protein DI563_11050 [Variovorax paradoxus]
MGGALSNFFGTAAKTVEDIADIEHRESLVEIERQNQARQEQGLADQAMGRERDPGLNQYQAYKGAYDVAVADSTANSMTQDLARKLRDLPNDGSVDPKAEATQYLKDQIGDGTGDPTIDGRMVWSAKQKADALVAQKREQIAQTQESNIAETIRNDITGKMLSQKGVTGGQAEAWHAQFLGLSKGNVAAADKLFEDAIGNAIVNDGHARSTLAALAGSGYAKRNPDSYMRLSDKAFHQTNKIKSLAAGTAVSSLNGEYTARHAEFHNQGLVMPTSEYLEFMNRAHRIDSDHGVGKAAFPWLAAGGLRENFKKQAAVNTILSTLRGHTATPDLRQSVNETGTEVSTEIKKNYVMASATWIAENPGRFPALNASLTAAGLPQPLANRDAAKEYGRMLGSPKEQAAFGYQVDDTTKGIITTGLMGSDVNQTINAVTLLNEVSNSPNGDIMLKGLLGDKEAARFDVIKRMSATRDIETAVRATLADKDLEKDMAAEQDSGYVNFPRLLRDPERKATEVEDAILSRAGERLKERIGRDDWFGEANTNISGQAYKALTLGIADHLREQQRTLKGGTKPDLNAAIDFATKQLASKFVPLPIQGNTLSLVLDPYGGRGRVPEQEIATYNGTKVYAGQRMLVGGKEEDPVETFMKIDRKAIYRKFPKFLGDDLPSDDLHGHYTAYGNWGRHTGDAESIYLLPPDAKSGLHPVMAPGGMPLMMAPGEEVVISNGIGTRATFKVPTDSKEAQEFFKTHLPTGFYALQGSGGIYRIQYGYRLTTTADEMFEVQSKARTAEIANINAPTRPVQFEKTYMGKPPKPRASTPQPPAGPGLIETLRSRVGEAAANYRKNRPE